MQRPLVIALTGGALLCATQAQALEAIAVEQPLSFAGACEPSGAVFVPDAAPDALLVVDDEDNILRFYDLRGVLLAADSTTVSEALDLDTSNSDDLDFEGATVLDGMVFLLGSHSRNNDGKHRAARAHLLAVTVEGMPPAVTDILTADQLLGAFADMAEFADAIGDRDDDDEDLAPDNGGFNLEGLSATADGQGLLIGVRAPLAGGDALVIEIANPVDVMGGADPVITVSDPLDLGGRGIRSLEYSPFHGTYLIMAGSWVDGGEPFELFAWDGAGQPVAIGGSQGLIAGLGDFAPEAMAIDGDGYVHLFSDEGGGCSTFRGTTMTLQ